MSICFTCTCGVTYRVGDDRAGRRVRCKRCQAVITVPAPQGGRPPVVPVHEDVAADDERSNDEGGEYDVVGTAAPVSQRSSSSDWQGQLQSLSREASGGPLAGQASNPGHVRIQWLKYFASFPVVPIFAVIVIAAACILGAVKHPLFYAGAGVLLPVGWRLRLEKWKFITGCVNPGVVVSRVPWRVAVMTDLSMGQGRYLAIKVIQQPLGQMTGGRPNIGDRVATAAYYSSGESDRHWADFHPTVVNCVTADEYDIRRAFESIEESDWRELEQALASLDVRRSGLYTLWDGNVHGGRQRNQYGSTVLLLVGLAALFGLAYYFGEVHDRQSPEAERRTDFPPSATVTPKEQAPDPTAVPSPPAPINRQRVAAYEQALLESSENRRALGELGRLEARDILQHDAEIRRLEADYALRQAALKAQEAAMTEAEKNAVSSEARVRFSREILSAQKTQRNFDAAKRQETQGRVGAEVVADYHQALVKATENRSAVAQLTGRTDQEWLAHLPRLTELNDAYKPLEEEVKRLERTIPAGLGAGQSARLRSDLYRAQAKAKTVESRVDTARQWEAVRATTRRAGGAGSR